jgi:hypothetical protein
MYFAAIGYYLYQLLQSEELCHAPDKALGATSSIRDQLSHSFRKHVDKAQIVPLVMFDPHS